MADDLATTAPKPAPLAHGRPAAPRRPRRPRVHQGRFLAAYAALLVLAAGAAGASLLLYSGGGVGAAGAAWSDWVPEGEPGGYPNQIAEHVGRRYRLPSGAQLVGIVAGPAVVQDVKVRAVAIEKPGAASSSDIDIIPTDNSVMYVLCGLGESCSIREGETTKERERLLRKQALEAALYTFTYVDGVDSVIVLLPPAPDKESGSSALFLQKGDLGRPLERPLRQTLERPNTRALESTLGPVEGLVVDEHTRPHLFMYAFQQLQDGGAMMVLSPPTPS